MPLKYTHTQTVQENHKQPLFCIAFNKLDPAHHDVLATVGKNQATVYRCQADGLMTVLQVYVDQDSEERFFSACWSADASTGAPLLLIAGLKGLVRMLDLAAGALRHTFAGHGHAVNDMCVLPHQPSLLLTAGGDEAIRLWNVATRVCVLIIGGEGGHASEVLSLDFHPWDQHRFLSSSMDSSLKIWSLKSQEAAVEASFAWQPDCQRAFPTRTLQFPAFSSKQLHSGYVDCVRWLGDLCLSKGVDQRILLWRPNPDAGQEQAHQADNVTTLYAGLAGPGTPATTSASFTLLAVLSLPDSCMWWVKFDLDAGLSTLACGNRAGKVCVWELGTGTPRQQAPLVSKACKQVVRKAAVSRDAHIIIAATEDGKLWRWDRRNDGSLE
ncbi:polycomb group protein [Haematococcus lacustris]